MEPTDLPDASSFPIDPPPPPVDRVGRGKYSPARIKRMERDRQAVELKRAGWGYDVIAQRLGYTNRGNAYKAIHQLLSHAIQESAEELRQMEVERMERLLASVWPFALGVHRSQQPNGTPDWNAVASVLRISERLCRIQGLNMPEQIEIKEIVAMIAEIRGYDDGEKQQATTYVENFLKDLNRK